VAPAGVTNVLVSISGVLQDPSTYGVVGNTITFSAAPPTGTGNISCRYLGVPVTGVTTTAYRTVTEFTATASQTTFTPPSYTVGFINVYLNGVLLGSADYTASNGTTVVLATGASAGNLVTVESFLVSSVLNALPQTGGTLNGTLNITGNEYVGGSLGVGTSSPASIIHAAATANPVILTECTTAVGSANAAYNVIKANSGSGGNYFRAILGQNGTGTYDWAIGNFGTDAQSIAFYTGGLTERMRLNSTGALVLQGGNTTANGVGITFPATQSASSNANTLDDYEEGTWTPTGNGITFSSAYGNYTKVGNTCTIWWDVAWPSTSDSGAAYIGGLPFTLAGNSWSGAMAITNVGIADVLAFAHAGQAYVYHRNSSNSDYSNAQFSARFAYGCATFKVA
jgi:hypothetical protein